MSPRQPPTATPHLLVRLFRKSDMSVGDQSRSQLAGRGRSFFHLLCKRRHVTPVGPPRQWMFPEGLLKWNVLAARADGRPGAGAATTDATLRARTTAANRGDIERIDNTAGKSNGHSRRDPCGRANASSQLRGARARPDQVQSRPDRLAGVVQGRRANGLRLPEG